MDLKNSRIIIETERDAFEAQGYLRNSLAYNADFLGARTTFYSTPNRWAQENITDLEEIVGERQELPFELYPSTSQLVIDGMRKVANSDTSTPDEKVRKSIAANHLINMNLPLAAGVEPAPVRELVSPHEL